MKPRAERSGALLQRYPRKRKMHSNDRIISTIYQFIAKVKRGSMLRGEFDSMLKDMRELTLKLPWSVSSKPILQLDIIERKVKGGMIDLSYAGRRMTANRFISQKWVRDYVFNRDSYTCTFCKSDERLSVDHITSIKRGGDNTLKNLQTLCVSCNSRKG
jgi:hypothetical protein